MERVEHRTKKILQDYSKNNNFWFSWVLTEFSFHKTIIPSSYAEADTDVEYIRMLI